MLVLSCAPRVHKIALHKIPDSVGTFAARDGAKLLLEVMNACRDEAMGLEEPWAADLTIRGSAGGNRVDRQLKVGFQPNGLFGRIESVPATASRSSLLFVTAGGRATLLLDNNTRVVSGQPFPAVFAAIAGVAMDVRTLAMLLRGCHLLEPGGYVTTYGNQWMSVAGGRNGYVYFHRPSPADRWRAMSLLYPGEGLQPAWRMDYHDFHEGIARTLLVEGMDGRSVSLEMRLSNVALLPSLPNDLFEAAIPASSQPIQLDRIDVARLLRGAEQR
jgi:hypothetical protein